MLRDNATIAMIAGLLRDYELHKRFMIIVDREPFRLLLNVQVGTLEMKNY